MSNKCTNGDLDAWIEKLRSNEKLEEKDVRALCDRAKEIYVNLPNI